MRQIVYSSVSRLARHRGALDMLCRQCSDNNARAGITGLLVFDGARFMQAIEGAHDAVEALMRRILADERHEQVSIARATRVGQREFGHFAMNFRHVVQGSGTLVDSVKQDVRDVRDPVVQAAFIGFATLGTARPSGG